MDALILSCGTGGGHDSAGRAVLEEMKKRGHHAVMFNPYTLKSDRLSGGIDKTYISAAQNVPTAFGAVYGIPTHSSFAAAETREEVKQRLGLDAGKKYIVITGGSMGGGKIEKAIIRLRAHFAQRGDTELIIICGSNRDLFDKLGEQEAPGITVIGHTDDMASYIKASHLFITKPGGLSSTEAAVCGVPIFHTAPIPGCESYNVRYFSSHGMSISGEITDGLLRAADDLLNDEHRSAEMTARQKELINPRAAADICDLAESMAAQK